MTINEAGDRTQFFGLTLDRMTSVQVIRHITQALAQRRGGWVFTVNLDVLRQWVGNRDLRVATHEVTLAVADGMPLLWAARISGRPLPERVTGADLVVRLSAAAAHNGYRLFLIGGAPGVADSAAQRLLERFPGLQIAGIDCPPVGFDHDPVYMAGLRDRLREAAPDIVYVGLGCPKQDYAIAALREAASQAWWIGVGGSFNFVTGDVARAPAWMQRSGLEWLHRLAQERRRLARRYFLHDMPFALRLLADSLQRRWAG